MKKYPNLMNNLGKGLVIAHVAVSIVLLAWAAGIYFQFTDWGWKEPRLEVGLRVPSEYDKRVATFKEAVKAVALAVADIKPAQASLREAAERFPQNHLYYVQELARVSAATEPIEVKLVKRPLTLDTPGKVVGRPALEEKVEGITKSYEAYRTDLDSINRDITKEIEQIRVWTKKAQDITLTLNGPVGVYALLEIEKKSQDLARIEKDYLEPRWAGTIREANVAGSLEVRLQAELNRLRKLKK